MRIAGVVSCHYVRLHLTRSRDPAEHWAVSGRSAAESRSLQVVPVRFSVPTYDNPTVAGDWTACGLNVGCVEAAVMSGRLAAHAIAQWPELGEIIGFDHL